MKIRLMSSLAYLFLLVSLLALSSCAGKKAETATELADALKSEGIAITSTGSADTSKLKKMKIDEAIILRGDSLEIEIFRIENQKHYKMFAGMGIFLGAVEKNVGKPLPGKPTMYARRP
ncbi:hypothetical protein ACFL1X_14300, partial [Candidatus Hydrogenedentota bacterium]